jgi:hypothetical protein
VPGPVRQPARAARFVRCPAPRPFSTRLIVAWLKPTRSPSCFWVRRLRCRPSRTSPPARASCSRLRRSASTARWVRMRVGIVAAWLHRALACRLPERAALPDALREPPTRGKPLPTAATRSLRARTCRGRLRAWSSPGAPPPRRLPRGYARRPASPGRGQRPIHASGDYDRAHGRARRRNGAQAGVARARHAARRRARRLPRCTDSPRSASNSAWFVSATPPRPVSGSLRGPGLRPDRG